jgi:hypothetical protein
MRTQPVQYKISLCFVRMALRPADHPNMLVSAISSKYAPVLNSDGTLLYGGCSILSTSNRWSTV